MQTSTTDLKSTSGVVKKKAVNRRGADRSSAADSASKLGTIGKGLAKKQSTTSIQVINSFLSLNLTCQSFVTFGAQTGLFLQELK